MAKRIIAGLLSDGRLQLWAVNDSDGSMQTRWKQIIHPDAAWTNWSTFDGRVKDIAAGNLPDGRLQLFAIGVDGMIYSRWKQIIHPDAAWTNWQQMNSGAMNRTFESIGAGNLPDGRLQLFIGDTSGNIWSMWKQTIHPDAAWTNFTNF